MKTVQPIRDHAKIDAMKKALLCKSERNYFLFVLGINVGMRISDLLPLRIGDLMGTHLVVQEKKTGKRKRFFINNQLRREIEQYAIGRAPEEYVFPAAKDLRLFPLQAIQGRGAAPAALQPRVAVHHPALYRHHAGRNRRHVSRLLPLTAPRDTKKPPDWVVFCLIGNSEE